MSDREVDPLLERIDRDLVECDARSLPPLTSGPAAAVLDLAELAGLKLDPWQQSVVRSMYVLEPPVTEPTGGLQMRFAGPAAIQGVRASEPIVDELVQFAPERPLPWWRRWWSR